MRILMMVMLALAIAVSGQAATVNLAWDASSGATGYKVYYGSASGNYTQSIDAQTATSIAVPSLTAGQTYYFAATAYNSANESGYSNEVSGVAVSSMVLTVPQAMSPGTYRSVEQGEPTVTLILTEQLASGTYTFVLDASGKPAWPFTLKSTSPQAGGLVLWYPMAPTTDTDVEDLSGNNRDAVQVNGASWVAGMNGGSSLDFDGTNDYVSLPSAASVASMTAASVSFWYRPDATPASNAALYYESTTTSGYTRFGVYHTATGDLLAVMRDSDTGSSFTVTETAPFTPGVWSHIVLTVNATTDSMVLYRNGASRGTPNTTAKGAFTSGTPADTIGMGAFTQPAGEAYINGQIDDFRIYNKALTQTDVDHLYNAATRYDLYQP